MTRTIVLLVLLALLPDAAATVARTPLQCVEIGADPQDPPRSHARAEVEVGRYGTARANASVESLGVGAQQHCRLPIVRPA
ncbi:MAG TPA: hypothetical protein VM582_07530 [Candidatus Thermoplasmatota archaeon]|nr:hypothetical protein [Candidatus Thermoplasmatota archaeon]